MTPPDAGPGVKVPPPLLYLATLALGILASAWFPLSVLPRVVAWTVGGALIVAGIVIGPVWGIATMRRAGTTVRPDKPSSRLVTSGPFRFSRNPLYLSLTLFYAGVALAANAGWALILLIPLLFAVQRFVIRREEAYLARSFGAEYERYKTQVRRWF